MDLYIYVFLSRNFTFANYLRNAEKFSLNVYLKVNESGEVLGDTDENCVACEGIA